MRRFAPALGGRLSRRNIALSPHLWSATGAMFAILGASTAAFPFFTDDFVAGRLWLLAAVLGTIAIVMLATRPPEPGTVVTHAVLAAVYLCTAASVVAYAPHGSATIVVGLFTGPLLATWLRSHRAVITHLTLATLAFIAAAALGGGDLGTIFATLCLIPSMWVLAGCCMVVLDAVERQGEQHERLALRDPLTAVGNRAFMDDALTVELARHHGLGTGVTLIALQLDAFAALNARAGRAAGDGVLATVAAVLSELAPEQAAVARIAGDRFAVLLPGAAPDDGPRFIERARRRLALVDTGGEPLATRAGIATFPADADTAEELLALASTRCDDDLAERRPRPAAGQRVGALSVHLHDELPVEQRAPTGTPSPESERDEWADRLVDRRHFGPNRLVWRLTSAFFLFYAALGAGAIVVDGTFTSSAPWVAVGLGVVLGLWILVTRSPEIGTRRNHAVIAATYVMPAIAMATCAPRASWCVGMGAFAGALIGVRLVQRRAIVAHLVAMTALLAALAVVARVDAASVVALLSLLLSTWVLAACYVSILEPSEAQARRMADLVLRDPLTGAGNRRLLLERLESELPRHADIQMPLVVASIGLSGIDELRDHHGPGAAAEALRNVAVLLSSAAGPGATVARLHDAEFQLLLPLIDVEDLGDLLRDVRLAIAGSSRRGEELLPQIGVAAFPEDCTSASALIETATARMALDDPRAHDLTIAPAEWSDPAPPEPIPARRRTDAIQPRRSAG